MQIELLRDVCTACGACMSECPKVCISMVLDAEGFYYPRIDKALCVECGKCDRVCHCLHRQPVHSERHSYYGFSKNPTIRQNSTSGGAFTALANSILKDNGNVYGAAFDFSDLRLKHQSTDVVSLAALQKSKYIESYMGDTIAKIDHDLKNGRSVLFCGTPCQAAGVHQALGNINGLLICDFICHGVPSSEIFRDYVSSRLRGNEKLIGMDFRPKDDGWSSKNIKLALTTTTTTTPYHLDAFYTGFMTENAFLRKSCYNCAYRCNHISDITIADFWGYRNLDPALNDEKGLSLIIANTEKGHAAVENLSNFALHSISNSYSEYAFKDRDYSKFLENRKLFYSHYNGNLKHTALKTYMKDYYIRWIKYRIKKILGRE